MRNSEPSLAEILIEPENIKLASDEDDLRKIYLKTEECELLLNEIKLEIEKIYASINSKNK